MKFSFIIPAFNAAETIAATLDAVLGQSYGQWQAIIVDDGSTDLTPSIAHHYCTLDHRFSLVRQSNGGLSAARNTGIAAAKYEYLVFLDADDWIAPDYLEKFNEEFENDPGLDAMVCGWQFVMEDGFAADVKYPPATDDMFPLFAYTCPFVVHACVINRRVIENAGVFDSKVGYVEDWDFWQRVSRCGARFGQLREILAFYRMRKGSLSRRVQESYNDARRMIRQGYGEDLRVVYPVARYEHGLDDGKMGEHMCWLYCWYGGLCLGVEEDYQKLEAPDLQYFEPMPDQLAEYIFESVYRGGCFHPHQWLPFYKDHQAQVDGFLEHLSLKTGQAQMIRDAKTGLLEKVVGVYSGGQIEELGELIYFPYNVSSELVDIHTNALKIVMDVSIDELSLGKLEFFPEQGILKADKIRTAIAEAWAWPIMTHYLQLRYPEIPAADIGGSRGWELFLRELWGLDWQEPVFYDENFPDENKYETKKIQGLLKLEIGRNLFHIRSRAEVLDLDYYIGGVLAGKLRIPSKKPFLPAQAIRAAICADGKFELCKLAVRQGLIGKRAGEIVLRDQLG